jgi:hypothetical protein
MEKKYGESAWKGIMEDQDGKETSTFHDIKWGMMSN